MTTKKSDERALQVNINESDFMFVTGNTFRGMTLSKKEDGWTLSVRATTDRKVNVYAMAFGEEPNELAGNLMKLLGGKEANFVWRLDNWSQ